MKKIAILLSGRGSNFIAIHNSIKSGYINAEISIVISNNPNAKGLEYAKKEGLKTEFVDLNKFDKDRLKYDLLSQIL